MGIYKHAHMFFKMAVNCVITARLHNKGNYLMLEGMNVLLIVNWLINGYLIMVTIYTLVVPCSA